MFGFVIGALCLIGLIKLTRGHRRWHGHGYGHWHGDRFARRRWGLRWAFRRLGTTAAQEKVILEAADALEAKRGKLFDELRTAREDLKSVLRGEAFDEARLRGAFERQQKLLEELQEAVLESAHKVFDVLQPDQRRSIAEALEYGPRGGVDEGCGARGGCYREAEAC